MSIIAIITGFLLFLLFLVFIGGVSYSVYSIVTGNNPFDNKSNNKDTTKKQVRFDENEYILGEKEGFINPSPFKTGYLEDSPQKIADACNSTMYPLSQPSLNYGVSKTTEPCAINLYNSSP